MQLLAEKNQPLIHPGDEGWELLSSCLNFSMFNRPKTSSNFTQFIQVQDFRAVKPLQIIGQVAELNFEPKFSSCQSSDSYSQRLFQEKIEVLLQYQWPSSWGSALGQLGWFGLEGTNWFKVAR